MSETPQQTPPEDPVPPDDQPRWPWVVLLVGLLVIAGIILASVLLRDEPADLPVDPAPDEEVVDEDPDPVDDEDALDVTGADAATSARFAAGWIARQIEEDGSVEIGFSGPVGNATQAALALAAAGVGGEVFDRAFAYVEANVDDFAETPDGDAPGALGYMALLAHAGGADPRDFGGHDLAARIGATMRTDGDDAGLYGVGDPTWDGVFRHSLALLGLVAAGEDPDDAAVEWLLAQQCDDGGWPSYRPPDDRADAACDLEVAVPDTNSTALAVQALAALDVESAHDALGWLAGVQGEDGGFGYQEGSATDSNSTGLVVQAIVAAGEDPEAGRWERGQEISPITALIALQIGCDADEDAQGAFAFQPEEDGSLQPNPATFQATWGVAMAPFPSGERELEPTVHRLC